MSNRPEQRQAYNLGEIYWCDPSSLPYLTADMLAIPPLTDKNEPAVLANIKEGINTQEA